MNAEMDVDSCESGSSNGAAVAIACIVTFIVSVTATAIITSIVNYHVFKRKFNFNYQPPQEKALYEYVSSPIHISTKDDLELQKNPSSDKVTMDTNPAYESCN